MDKLDAMIKEALEGEDKAIYDQTEELGYFAQAMTLFSGKTGWVSWVIMIAQSALFLVGVWCAVAFFQAQDVLSALKWGLSGATLLIMAGMLKFSLMPVMQGDRVIRELKRVELMLASRRD